MVAQERARGASEQCAARTATRASWCNFPLRRLIKRVFDIYVARVVIN